MTDPISEEGGRAMKAVSSLMETYDFRDDNDDDNFFSIELYKTPEGKHFRFVATTGMNSAWAGAMNFYEWVKDDLSDWKDEG